MTTRVVTLSRLILGAALRALRSTYGEDRGFGR
jgi:hypothetical protein